MSNQSFNNGKEFSVRWGEKDLTVSFNNLAERANGEALIRYGDTVVHAVVTMSGEDVNKGFFPLSVNYEEKFYAAGKIGGSRYTRREGRPSDRATIISRMIDRALRPRFPKELKREVQIVVTCLSWDEVNDPAVLGMIASSVALVTSNVPWNGPLGAVRVGKSEDVVINPCYEVRLNGSSDLVVGGFIDEDGDTIINMIEASFNEESEDSVIELFKATSSEIKKLCDFQKEIASAMGKEKISLEDSYANKDVELEIASFIKEPLETIFTTSKNREEELEDLRQQIHIYIVEKYEDDEDIKLAKKITEDLFEGKIREKILKEGERVDFRKTDEVRKISCEVSILPRTHGSALFQRGQTKALSIVTLGAPGEEQLTDAMELSEKKRFMHHYNFPSSSVGEVGPIRGPGRREIGHGMLAEKAIAPVIPDVEDFPYTIRTVSEIVCSNGSTSMASICGTTLALMDAGVPIKKPVAGISIGLVAENKNNYALLTDIQGVEDHYGDMDFKVGGTDVGITAIQMDVKIAGITLEMIEDALAAAKKTRLYIIEKIKEAIPEPRKELSSYAPRIVTIKVKPEKIGEIIGPKGRVINDIIDRTGVAIDIGDDGTVSIVSENEERIRSAVAMIEAIIKEPEIGNVFDGRVVKIMPFGAFVEILPGKEALLHVSEISDKRIEKVEDFLTQGQSVKVKVVKIDKDGKVGLSMKGVAQQ